jgi:hypothetical protein
MGSILSINDIKSGLPYKLVEILENNDADLPTWESAKFIYDNKKWGNFVLLTTDVSEGVRQGKYVKILSDNIFQVEGFTCDEVIT